MNQSKNNRHPGMGHSNVKASSEMNRNHYSERRCDCGPDCKCGCQEGKPCSCGNGGSCGILSGLFTLVGCLLIAGSIFYVADNCSCMHKKGMKPVAPVQGVASKAEMEKVVTAYVKTHPEVIAESLQAYYENLQREQRAKQVKNIDDAMLSEILNDKTNTVLGNAKGSFVIIEFFDYQCGHCQNMNKKMAEAVKKSNNIRWVLMDSPIFGEKSEIIARYALAAGKQGKFKEYHEALGSAQDKSEEGLKKIGKTLGLNVEKLTKDSNSNEVKARLAKNREYAEVLGFSHGVPGFVINGKVQMGGFPDEQMEEYIKQANEMKKAK